MLQLFDKLIDAMRQQSPLFAKTFQKIVWAGSYYKGTRYGQPEEYDLNFVINLPIKEQRVKLFFKSMIMYRFFKKAQRYHFHLYEKIFIL